MRSVILAAVSALFLLAAGEAAAQRMPERSLVRKGNKEYSEGNYQKSIDYYERAKKFDSTRYEVIYNLSSAYARNEQADKAEELLRRVAADTLHRTDAERAEALFNLGDIEFGRQRLPEALECFKQSLRLNPSDMEAKYNYAYVKHMLDRQNQNNQDNQDNQQNQQNQQNQDNQNGDGGQNDPNNDNPNNDKDNQQGDQNKDQNQNQNNQDRNNDSDNNGQNGRNNPDDRNRNDNKDKNDDGSGNNNDDDRQDRDKNRSEGDGDGDGERNGNRQPRPNGISREQAEQTLEAIQAQEDKTQEKVKERQGVIVRGKKNW